MASKSEKESRRVRHIAIQRLAQDRNVRYGLIALCFRKGWRCHLCGMSIPEEFGPTDPWRPTRDHIHVAARGGGNHADNIELAHSFCNERRATKSIGSLDLVEYRQAVIAHSEFWPVMLNPTRLDWEPDRPVRVRKRSKPRRPARRTEPGTTDPSKYV